jgi:hypothetical protein
MVRQFTWLISGLAIVAAVALAAEQPAKEGGQGTKEDPLRSVQAFTPFLGEWQIEGAWDDGRPLKARNVFEWGIGGKHIKVGTFLLRPEGDVQRYDGMLTWHPRKQCLASYSFAVDGGISEYRVDTADGKTFTFGFEPWDSTDAQKIRQTIVFENPKVYTWTVEAHEGEEWKRLIKGQWKRIGK